MEFLKKMAAIVEVINKLLPSIFRLSKDKLSFHPDIRNYLLTHVFYFLEEFMQIISFFISIKVFNELFNFCTFRY
jgi:hypothetical protein